MNIREVNVDYYKKLVINSSRHQLSISKDAKRTFKNDENFKLIDPDRTKTTNIVRAFFHKGDIDLLFLDVFFILTHWSPIEQNYNFVQGLNLIAGIFLYVMKNEVDAFYCFHHFMTKMYPMYFMEDYNRTPKVYNILFKLYVHTF